MEISKTLASKSNILNAMHMSKRSIETITQTELKLLAIYLGQINPFDISTRTIEIYLTDFQSALGIKKINLENIRQITEKLMQKIIEIPSYDDKNKINGYQQFGIFKYCRIIEGKNEFNSKIYKISLDCNDEVLYYLFNLKEKYTKYMVENVLKLTSVNQIRLYELLKQYQKIGFWEVSLSDLKALLFIRDTEYIRWTKFKVDVLEKCKKNLSLFTDISFNFEPVRVAHNKTVAVKFKIFENTEINRQPKENGNFILDNIQYSNIDTIEDTLYNLNFDETIDKNTRMSYLSDLCENTFKIDELNVIIGFIEQFTPINPNESSQIYAHRIATSLKTEYFALKLCNKKRKINDKFAYISKILSEKVNKYNLELAKLYKEKAEEDTLKEQLAQKPRSYKLDLISDVL